MTITLDIRPEVRAELARQAAAQGRALEAYAASLLEDAAHIPADSVRSQRDYPHKSLRAMFESVKGLADDVDFARNKSTARPVDLS
jgi:hypothetical protein